MALDWLQGLDEGPVSTLPCPSDAEVARLKSTSWAELKRYKEREDSAIAVEYANALLSTSDHLSTTLSRAHGQKRELRSGMIALAELIADQVDESGRKYPGLATAAAADRESQATQAVGDGLYETARRLMDEAAELRRLPYRLVEKALKLQTCSHHALGLVNEEDGAVSAVLWRCKDKLCPVCSRIESRRVQERQEAAVQYFDPSPEPDHYYLLTLTQISRGGEHLVDAYDRLGDSIRALSRGSVGRQWSSLVWGEILHREIKWQEAGRWHAHAHGLVRLEKHVVENYRRLHGETRRTRVLGVEKDGSPRKVKMADWQWVVLEKLRDCWKQVSDGWNLDLVPLYDPKTGEPPRADDQDACKRALHGAIHEVTVYVVKHHTAIVQPARETTTWSHEVLLERYGEMSTEELLQRAKDLAELMDHRHRRSYSLRGRYSKEKLLTDKQAQVKARKLNAEFAAGPVYQTEAEAIKAAEFAMGFTWTWPEAFVASASVREWLGGQTRWRPTIEAPDVSRVSIYHVLDLLDGMNRKDRWCRAVWTAWCAAVEERKKRRRDRYLNVVLEETARHGSATATDRGLAALAQLD